MSDYTIWYYSIVYCTILHFIIRYVWYYIVLYGFYFIVYCIVIVIVITIVIVAYCSVLCYIILYYFILYCIVLYHIILYHVIYIYIILCYTLYIYIYCFNIIFYLLYYIIIYSFFCYSPSETYRFDFLLCFFTVFFDCFFLQKQPAFFHSFEDFGCLSVMSYDASCVHTMAYFDGICSVFDYRILGSKQGVSIQTLTECARRCGQMSILSFKLFFYNVFIPSFDTWILDFVHFEILQTYCLMIYMVDMFLASFSLLCSFCLLYHGSGSILWMCGS